jgi:hypothetical protein
VDWKQIVTVIVAVVGAVTGLSGVAIAYLAYRRETERDRVHARISVMNAIARTPVGLEDYLAIEVVNLSTFPITLSQIGFASDSMTFLPPPSHWQTPCRLDARSSVAVHYPLSAVTDTKQFAKARIAFVRTQCGHMFESERVEAKIQLFLAGRAKQEKLR